MTGEQFKTAHDQAGKAYAEALAALNTAFVELAAHDRVAGNANIAALVPGAEHPVRTFADLPHGTPDVLIHPIFAPAPGRVRWSDQIETRARQIVAQIVGA